MSASSQTRADILSTPRPLSPDDLAEIVARGSSLGERLGLLSSLGPSTLPAGDTVDVEALLERWRRLVAEGDDATFGKRLSWDGLDLDRARLALNPSRLPHVEPLPDWADTVRDVLEAAAALSQETPDEELPAERCYHPGSPLPFQDILLPFVLVARVRLAEQAGPAVEQLSPQAAAILENRLLQRLTSLCANPLLVEFAVRRQRRQSSLTRLLASLQADPGTDLYRQFTRAMLAGELADVFLAYPVLARLTATVTKLWVDAVAEFLHRLNADRAEIQTTFHPDVALGDVVGVGEAVSDSHNNGRSVLALTFESGLRLIYKPKDVHLEQAYFDLLGWLEARGAPLTFRRLRIIARSGYGWAEVAETLPCPDADAARRYYRRAGMLLGLLYGLAGNDCHYDNIVAHGEHPVLVDMETFMHPQPQPFEDDAAAEMLGARAVATDVFRASVLSTGLLPRWVVNNDGRTHDASGLGGVGAQRSFDALPRWQHINTDAMTVTHEFVMFRATQNVAVLDGNPLSPNDYVEEIVDGLRIMYLLLLQHREDMLAPDGPLAAFARQPVRFLLRDTRIYAVVLDRALRRPYLRDGAAFSIELDVLSRALVTTSAASLFWPLRRDEQDAMERLDIPFFATRADSADLELSGGVTVRQAFTSPGYELAAERLQLLSPEDLDRQMAYTRASLFSRTASSLGEAPSEPATTTDETATRPLSQGELVAAAEAIARELQEHAIRSPDGGTSWIGVALMPQAERYQLEPTGFDLYSGNPGIAMFLAALARVTGSTDVRESARRATQQASQMVRAHPERLARGLGIGGAVGIGSLVYALVRTGQLLDDADLVADGERASALITPDRIAADRGVDVLVGSAGALLGLLALYEVTGRAEDLESARLCGRHVVTTQLTDGPERGSWPTLGQIGMTGFSHGAAGIAYALLRLFEHTDDPDLQAAAAAAIAYERRVFAPDEGNWPDVRKETLAATGGQRTFMTQWCHGATGIGLARLAGLAALDTPDVREDIDLAVTATLRFGPQGVDHPCCGSMGRAELLASAGRRLDRPELVEESGRFAATVVRRADESGYRVLGRLPRGVGCPSFFQGTAGIGYQLLRLAHPDRLPSVLLWG